MHGVHEVHDAQVGGRERVREQEELCLGEEVERLGGQRGRKLGLEM